MQSRVEKGRGENKRGDVKIEEDAAGKMGNAKEMFTFPLHLEPEAFTNASCWQVQPAYC